MRPVGANTPARRPVLGVRQVLIVLLVLVLGGGIGTGAYFLSDFDLRAALRWLDVSDLGPRLTLPLDDDVRQAGGSGGLLAPPQPAGGKGTPAGVAQAPAAPPAPPPLPTVAGAQPVVVGAAPAPDPAARAKTPAGQPPSYADIPAQTAVQPLSPAPDKALLAPSPRGALPVISADGRLPGKVYAHPAVEVPAGQPRVAVLVGGLGLDRVATEAAITRLPGIVSLGFSPYAPDLATWIAKARAGGHEALVGLPAETADYPAEDPGPLGLLVQAKPEDNLAHLETILASAPGAAGVYMLPSRFTASDQMPQMLGVLLQRGVLYVGDGVQGTRVPAWAGIGLTVGRDATWREAVDARLEAVAAAARTQGAVVVEASASPLMFQRLTAWMSGLAAQGMAAVPVSSVLHAPGKS